MKGYSQHKECMKGRRSLRKNSFEVQKNKKMYHNCLKQKNRKEQKKATSGFTLLGWAPFLRIEVKNVFPFSQNGSCSLVLCLMTLFCTLLFFGHFQNSSPSDKQIPNYYCSLNFLFVSVHVNSHAFFVLAVTFQKRLFRCRLILL